MTRTLRMLTRVMATLVLVSGLAAVPVLANPAGPHLDGDAYTGLRPAAPVPTLKFTMDVECLDSGGQDLVLYSHAFGVQPEREGMRAPGHEGRSQVTLGPDFVVSRGRYGTVVYDLRFRRVLTIGIDEQLFSNHSLYGHFRVRLKFLLNNLFTLASVTKLGVKKKGAFSLPVSRFLVEHANGIFHPLAIALKHLPVAPLNVDRRAEMLVASVSNTEVLKAEYGTIGFPSAVHGRTFAAWLAWFFRIHPKLAQVFADDAAPPSSLRFIVSSMPTAMGPSSFPACSVLLSDVSRAPDRLDVLAGLASRVPAWPPILPGGLIRLMIDAVRLQAPNGPTDNATYLERIRKLAAEKRYFDALLLSAHTMASTESCTPARHDAILCETTVEAFQTTKSAGSVGTVRKAMSASSQGNHGKAAEMLISLRDRSPDRPDILEFMIANEVVEARRHSLRHKSPMNEQLQKEFDGLPNTFEAALGFDPYSPARFRDISNYVRLATRSLAQKYFWMVFETVILDLGRALPGGRVSHFFKKANARERKTAEAFPELFPEVADAAE